MNKAIENLLATLVALLIVLPLLSLLSGFISFLIWNNSVSYTLHLPQLGFWQVYFVNWLVGVVGSHFKSTCTSK